MWLYDHMIALGKEYTKRYGKEHLTIIKCRDFLATPPANIQGDEWVDPPQCMPDECKRDDAVLGYQIYYNYKADDWDARGIPMKWYGQEAV